MSMKRNPDDGKGRSDGSGDDKRRRHAGGSGFSSVVCDIMRVRKVQNMLEPILEPLIRRVVKEEVELALRKHMSSMKWSCGKEIEPPETRNLRLVFMNGLSLPVFTGTKIEGDDGSSLRVALVDVRSGQVFNTGPESSAKVEVVVLEGDFDSDDSDNWSVEEFKSNIVREREGKKGLLTGDAVIDLKDGVGFVGEISLTDNSSWTRSRKFRLGVRVVDIFEGTRIKEAKTDSFIVRDHRGELYKKHHPPALFDEVWRLEKIGKDGAFHKRLTRENITTVKDFLTLLNLNATRLRQILGTGMSAKMWEVTVEHASTCMLDKRVFLYCPPGSERKTGVVFNVVRQVKGVLSDGRYIPIDSLAENDKVDAQKMVIDSCEHLGEVIPFDDEASLFGGPAQLDNQLQLSSSATMESLNSNKFFTSNKICGGSFEYAHSAVASPDIISSLYSIGGGVSSIGDFSPHGMDSMGLRYDHLNFTSEVSPTLLCDSESIAQAFLDEDHLGLFDSLQPHDPILEAHTGDLHSAVKGFLCPSSSAAAVCKAQRRWNKVCNVLKWFKVLARNRIHAREIERFS
uniref:Calmodulin-binding protein n=1 Tax=Kalanchoe fedtschenkoi TaxID=63787 RepID=A0A7N0VFN6_KALFE